MQKFKTAFSIDQKVFDYLPSAPAWWSLDSNIAIALIYRGVARGGWGLEPP